MEKKFYVVSQLLHYSAFAGPADKHPTLERAVEEAERKTRHAGGAHYVHEVTVRPVYSFTPGPAVKEEL